MLQGNQTFMDFQVFFDLGMKRHLNPIKSFIQNHDLVAINLGCGQQRINHTVSLDLPDWDADIQPIPWNDDTVDIIWALHFLEHCADPVKVLLECQRVLKQGGLMNIVVPYYSSQIAHQDLDHKHFFTEETWKTLFKNQYYDKNRIEWEFDIQFNLIAGIVERNLCLFTQLRRK